MLSAASDIDNSSVLGNIAGLCSGFFWGLGTVALRRWPHIGPAESVSTQFFFASAASFAFVLALEDGFVALPELSVWVKAVPPIIGYYILLVIPSLFALFWAAQRVSPGRTGILMMSEVIVAAITAAWLAGEVMSFQETLGAVFIVAAGLFEVIGSPEPSQSA